MFDRFSFFLDVDTILWFFMLNMLIIPNKIENKSKDYVQISKMTIEEKR